MRTPLCFVLIAVAASFLLTQSATLSSAAPYVENHVLVKWVGGANSDSMTAVLSTVGGIIVADITDTDYHVVELADTFVCSSVSRMNARACVDDATPDWIIGEVLTGANDPYYPVSWHLHNTGQTGGTAGADINAEEGWKFKTDASGILIATLDTGLGYSDSDLVATAWNNPGETGLDGSSHDKRTNGIDDDSNGYKDDYYGYDLFSQDSDPWDENEPHGTYVTSVMAATGNNNLGLTGVAWGAKVAAVRVGSPTGFVPLSAAQLGMSYTRAINAKVLNLSWGARTDSIYIGNLRAQMVLAEAAGQLVVCGAGNNGFDNDNLASPPMYPASFSLPNIISVGMTDDDDLLVASGNPCSNSTLSDYGANSVDIMAPGCGIWSETQYNIYQTHSGTSLAAPQVSAAAALVWAQHPTWTYADVKDRLMTTVDTLASLSGKCVSGGRLNIGRALDNIPPSPVTFTYERGRHSVKVMWTETGDDSTDGTATVAKIMWSSTTSLNNETDFNAATPVPLDIPLGGAGTEHCVVFTSLTGNHTYYVGVKLEDGEFNWSSIGSGSVATLPSGSVEVEECPLINRPGEFRTPIRPTDEATLVWALESARPNPTSGAASIDYSTKVGGPVRIGIYNVAGRLVRTLVNEIQPAGTHTVVWNGTSTDGSRVRGGVYFYRMVANGWQSDRRLVVLGQ